ncbi:RagB/SusD family nutrient uptake outer membrane protein [Parapedobacter sp. 2B3]|uniref:RagB/SusD family nutrient uptake outer membrane protein n=1 Tax=Parapedobacter sp. 2B3 TaxID=3342381 RepID=UPI0035B69B39
MKSNFNRILLFILMFSPFLHGCYGKLDSEMYDAINPSIFPKNANDIEALVTACYYPFRNAEWAGLYNNSTGIQNTDLTTDICMEQWAEERWLILNNLNWNASTLQLRTWYSNYNQFSKMTMNIERISNVQMDEDLKARYIAEIRCARGWMAFIMFNLYGPIPVASLDILENPLTDVVIERPTQEWMVNYIETELTEAAKVLPYKYGANDWGRFTKGMAQMILLKLYMHEKNWSKAETIGRELMKPEYEYRLMDNYSSIFTLENEQNSEIIYATPNTIKTVQTYLPHVLPTNYPVKNANIPGWSGFRIPWFFYHTFEVKDKRLEVLVGEYTGTDGITYNEENPGIYMWGGAIPVKYGEDPQATGHGSQIDWIVYRYADAVLLLAEAIANNNGNPTTEAIELINMVRRRAGLDDLELKDYNTLKKINELILLERGHELWFEGCRREDLIRHGKYIEYARQYKGSLNAQDHFVLFPIPQEYINEGKGKIQQNPGY